MMTPKKRQEVKNDAARLAAQQPTLEASKAFEEDYINIMMTLNEKIDERLDTFRSEALPILRDAYPTRPQGILSVIAEETTKIREVTQTILATMESVKNPEFRACAKGCIKDITDFCSDAVAQQYIRAEIRAKMIFE